MSNRGGAVIDAAPGWRPALLALVLCLGWILFWFGDTGAAMVAIWWRSETFTHAFLVPPISLWLIWRRRRVLASLVPQPWWPAVILMLLTGFGWLLAEVSAVNSVTQFALVAMLVLTVPALLGLRLTWAMLFPLGFLFFAVPIGEFVMPQFMAWTADFTVAALRFSGIPVYREGMHFIIPSGQWSVVEACSGVRYLIASVVVGTLYAYLTYRALVKRLLFVAVSIVVPIVANWLRAYMIVMLGHLSDNRLAVGIDHLIYGWVFFGIVMVLMYLIGSRWADSPSSNEPEQEAPSGRARRRSAIWLVATAVAFATMLPYVWLTMVDHAEATRGRPSMDLVLPAPTGWQLADGREIDWTPAYQGMRSTLQAEFIRNGRRVGVFVGYYWQQDYEHKLISSQNVLVRSNDPIWSLVDSEEHRLTIGGRSFDVDAVELKSAAGKRLSVWRWYWIDGRLTVNPYLAKLYQASARLAGRGDDSAVVIVYTKRDMKDPGRETLKDFARNLVGRLDEVLQSGR